MEQQAQFQILFSQLGLGTVLEPVKQVAGGYMHKMYRVVTERGAFAVKCLNPAVMERPGAFDNYRLAEELERKLQASGIPIVPALEFGGLKMQRVGRKYGYVFDWFDGSALRPEEITREHCAVMGSLLARIHRIERRNVPITPRELLIDWDRYIALSADRCPEITAPLRKNRALLYSAQAEADGACGKLPGVVCICDGDMDRKNVLWCADGPRIIDLECLGYGNPYTELLQLALCWSGYEVCRIDYGLLTAFIRSYAEQAEGLEADWEVLYQTYTGHLRWLEYNIKRALRIECENDEERALGIEQVFKTLRQIAYYSVIRQPLLEVLGDC